MGLFTKPGTIYSERPEILASDHFTSQSCMVTQDMAVEIDGRLIVRKGTIYPANDETAIGIIITDVDVTHGDAPGAYIDHGFVYAERLPVVADPDAVSALKGIIFRNYKGPVSSAGVEEEVTQDPDKLVSLAFSAGDVLTPAFSPSVKVYTLVPAGATSTVTAVFPDGASGPGIILGADSVENGGTITWAQGENTVTVFFYPTEIPSGDPITYTVTATIA